ncbi:MAG: hypothetical protein ABIG69_10395 [Bacteroidota bacterium]|nr:hypothetical protein [Bacteroidota bacterium]
MLTVIIILLLIPFKFPDYIRASGKIYPAQEWVLVKDTDGRISASLFDRISGVNKSFGSIQFERGDAVDFKIVGNLFPGKEIFKNDTVAVIVSNEIEQRLVELTGELEVAKASLSVVVSGEKESVLAEEKNRLAYAETQLKEEIKLFARQQNMFEKQLISEEEFDIAKTKVDLFKINVDITKKRIAVIESGAKEAEVNVIKKNILSLQSQIDILKKRAAKYTLTSPIDGIVMRSFSSDTIFAARSSNKYIVYVPIKIEELKKVAAGSQTTIELSFADTTLMGSINNLSGKVQKINGRQYSIALVMLSETALEIPAGLIVLCDINVGEITLSGLIYEFMGSIISI